MKEGTEMISRLISELQRQTRRQRSRTREKYAKSSTGATKERKAGQPPRKERGKVKATRGGVTLRWR